MKRHYFIGDDLDVVATVERGIDGQRASPRNRSMC